MAKDNRLPSWNEIVGKPKIESRSANKPDIPTYDELMFDQKVTQYKRGKLPQEEEQSADWDITIPNDVNDAGTEMTTAPTINPKRPRALTIGYNPNSKTLIVVFRDNTWWQYNDVPVDMWLGLRNSGSTGKYLREQGLDTWPDMGPANMDALSESVKVQIQESSKSANEIQNSNSSILRALMGQKSLRDFTAEELFRE